MKHLCTLVIICVLPLITIAQTEIRFYTTEGEFMLNMYDSLAPITSGNFIDLVEDEFYDGVIFHRVIDNFMIQGGDPTGTGFGGPGYTIPDEFGDGLSNVQKTISMANSGPNTGGSQFFINLVNNTYLDFDKPPYTSAHPVFGIVVDGWSVVQAIGDVPVSSGNNKPLTDVVMDSVRIISYDTLVPDTTNTDTTDTTVSPPASIGSVSIFKDVVRVFPNPIDERSTLSIAATKSVSDAEIRVYDFHGRAIHRAQVPLVRGRNYIPLKTLQQDLPQGLYVVQVSAGGEKATTRFLVTRD